MSFRAATSCGFAVALMIVLSPAARVSAAQKAVKDEPARPAITAEKTQVLVEMQFIQIDDPIQGVSLRGTATVDICKGASPPKIEADSIEITTAKVKPPAAGDVEGQLAVVDLSQTGGIAEGLSRGGHLISPKTVLLVRGRELRFERGKIIDDKAADEMTPPNDKGYKVLSTPRLLVLVGDEAEMTMGSAVPYMVQREDGCLELRHTDGADEGISIRLRVEKADKRRITFESILTKLSMVTGRQPIEGVPFDVGRPIIRSMEVSSALSLSPDHTALIALPRVGKDSPLILATISARLNEE